MARYMYGATVPSFLGDNDEHILGRIVQAYSNQNLAIQQTYAWQSQLPLLRRALSSLNDAHLFLEFSIPRMGKRADAVLFARGIVLVLEFKVGEVSFFKSAIEQVEDYALDLKNFHEGSHHLPIIPILVATDAHSKPLDLVAYSDGVYRPLCCNEESLESTITSILGSVDLPSSVEALEWADARYKPTPTIIEAAQALYENHSVAEISRSEAGAINLAQTSDCINEIISDTEASSQKSIVLLTGVPGAGKTLAGLNIATQNMAIGDDHSVFLSGNGPLVDVLREALAENLATAHGTQRRQSIGDARRRTRTFIQNIHHFRDFYLEDPSAPADKVVVFDEAQRAWTKDELSRFMRQKKGRPNFNLSEPHFLLDIMNRHESCSIVCLIGGGQEINRGEAGVDEWVATLRNDFTDWKVYFSNSILEDGVYLRSTENTRWLAENGRPRDALHLKVSVRSFRSEKLAAFVEALVNNQVDDAKGLFVELEAQNYPLRLTRSLGAAKAWLKANARGSERYGLVASSGAQRLRKFGIWVKSKIEASDWFLKPADDIRSSMFLEETATEFDIQGLELDWIAMCWDADFYYSGNQWNRRKFKGTRWERVSDEDVSRYLVNAYRVLLTRARQGMIIFVPCGDDSDQTRLREYYDGTYNFLRGIGIPEIE